MLAFWLQLVHLLFEPFRGTVTEVNVKFGRCCYCLKEWGRYVTLAFACGNCWVCPCKSYGFSLMTFECLSLVVIFMVGVFVLLCSCHLLFVFFLFVVVYIPLWEPLDFKKVCFEIWPFIVLILHKDTDNGYILT